MMTAEYKKVCRVDDLENGKTKLVLVNGNLVMLAMDEDRIHAMSGYCTHDGEELDSEVVEEGEVECLRHGARFDVQTGEVTQPPALVGLLKYDVKVEDGQIYVCTDD